MPEALPSRAVRTRRLGTEGPQVSVIGLGCNNFGMRVDLEGTRAVVDAAQVEEVDALACERGWARPVSAQNEYSLLRREVEQELLPVCERLGIGVLPYFPLASGLLTGKYGRGDPRPEGTRLSGRDEVFTDEKFDRIEALERYASERGLTLLQVAIGGLLGQPALVSVIAGATKPEQVR